ncbi:MAG: tetratricopeptide repeat protein, partial [Litorimonas sp.]
MNNFTKICASVASLGLLAYGPAFASSSGGGGGISSSSSNSNIPTQQYNPVKDYQAGLTALRANDFKRADKMFKRVLGGTTRNAQANYYMGVTKVGLGKDKNATRYFKKAAKYEKGFYEAEAGLGQAYAASGQIEKAQKTLAKLQTSS